MINIPKGTKDVLPSESYKWHKIEEEIRLVAKKYNLKEIRTPIFEHTELFKRGVGEGSDIVNKEMYTFLDKGERSLTLKPEGTAPVVRSFIENGLFNEAMPLKLYYTTPCLRYEKPQAGRLRQHTQFGVELFGSNSYLSEIETLQIIRDFLNRFNINPTIHINNLGCEECNKKYKILLKEFVAPLLGEICPDCRRRWEVNPLRVLDCKVESCKKLLKNAPNISEVLCEDCNTNFSKITNSLKKLNFNYKVNERLVRGIDYYTNTVFEVIDEDKNLGQNTLAAGGRYNKLVEELGGKSVPVIGFGLGIERLLLYLESKGIEIENKEVVDVYIAVATTNKDFVLDLAEKIRNNGIGCEIDLMDRSLKAQFKYADKLKCKFVVTVGDSEIESKTVNIKNMQTGVQENILLENLINHLRNQ